MKGCWYAVLLGGKSGHRSFHPAVLAMARATRAAFAHAAWKNGAKLSSINASCVILSDKTGYLTPIFANPVVARTLCAAPVWVIGRAKRALIFSDIARCTGSVCLSAKAVANWLGASRVQGSD